ncbi:four-carbon acid sugar kinase family protein [Luteococcus sp. H138]|uniref:four-carbon acid sugar kinase family protein n=1 Tax=unclassified Luteococcus TaxID=2639923 RepID=UPI00313E71B5
MSDLGLVVIADDLTGANDCAVSYALAGCSTELLMDASDASQWDPGSVDVTSVSSDSRSLGGLARARTRQLLDHAMERGANSIFLKIDSTMRGSVSHQVTGALDAWSRRHPDSVAVICPAYPALARTIEDGILKVNGIEVTETPSGRDPVCPVPSALMADLVPDAVGLENPGEATELARHIREASARQVIIDAMSPHDVEVIAKAIMMLGDRAIPVGSAGLAKAMARSLPAANVQPDQDPLPISGRVLVVVSSVHDVSQDQVDAYIGGAQGGDAIVFSPHPAQLTSADALPTLRGQLRALVDSGPGNVIVRANPSKLRDVHDREELAQRVAGQLAGLAADALDHVPFGALVLVGGDGAAATLAQMGVRKLRVLRAVAEGTPLGIVQETRFSGLPVVTKSGGFGGPGLLGEIISLIQSGVPAQTEDSKE